MRAETKAKAILDSFANSTIPGAPCHLEFAAAAMTAAVSLCLHWGQTLPSQRYSAQSHHKTRQSDDIQEPMHGERLPLYMI